MSVINDSAKAPVAANGIDTSRISGWSSDPKVATMIR